MGGFVSKDDSRPQGPVKTINHNKMLQNIDEMFKSVHATQVTDLPHSDGYSSTSDVDVSTIRPMTGGGSFTYTRNRYQKYEDKLRAAMRGGNGDAAPGPQATPVKEAEKVEVDVVEPDVDIEDFETAEADVPSTDADLAEQRKKLKEMMDAAADSLDENREDRDPLLRPEPQAERPDEMEGMDIGRQMGGMTVDREIENIRSFLLNTNNAQRGGDGMEQDMDDSLKMARDSLLNNQMGGNMVFSATSENPIDYNLIAQAGGNIQLSATSDLPVNVNASTLSATSENPIDYNLLMRGGAKKNQTKVDSEQSGGDDMDDSSSSTTTEEKSSSSSSEGDKDDDDSSTSSSNDVLSDVGIDITDIMRLQRGIDKRQNRSNFLRGDYVMTSNSDNNYKISGRPYFSSQSSEYQNEVASEFLNTMRSRNRS